MAAIVLIASLTACHFNGKKDEQYKTEKVGRGDITMTVTATGTLSAVTTVQIGSQVSGVIAKLYADFNSQVKKGQLLAELDPTPFQQQVAQHQADVTKARVDAANAKITYERQRRLTAAGLAAQADLDAAKAAYDGAQAQVQQAVATLQQSETSLKYTKIVSPIDGTVVDREYDVGQTVAASFQAPTLFAIAQDLTKMQVQADVDQSDIGRVQVGQVAVFTVDSYPDQEFKGRISQIRLNATVTSNVVTYPVIIEVPNPDDKLRPKMTANVTINVATVNNVLRIPNAALRFKPEGAVAPATATARGSNAGTSTAAGTTAAETSGTAGGTAPPATASAGGEGRHRWNRGGGGGGGSAPGSPEGAVAAMGNRQPGIGGAAGPWSGAGRGQHQRRNQQPVYILDPTTQKPKAVMIRAGITDGHYTAVFGGDLKEGDMVIVGLATSKVEGPAPPGAGSPFGGGARGGGGGGRGR